MKATGIVRQVDPLGRVVLPKELRDIMEIKEKTPLEIYTDKDSIILKKYDTANTCMLTGNIAKEPCILADGKIVLSPEGVELLLHEINTYLLTNKDNTKLLLDEGTIGYFLTEDEHKKLTEVTSEICKATNQSKKK